MIKRTGKAGLDPRVAAEFAMAAAHNDLVELHADGEHAQQAVNALIAVIQKS